MFKNESIALDNELSGKVVLIGMDIIPSGEHQGKRGFFVKAETAQNAGAVGVIFANNDERKPDEVVMMGRCSRVGTLSIPVIMVSYKEGIRARNAVGTNIVFGTKGQCATHIEAQILQAQIYLLPFPPMLLSH